VLLQSARFMRRHLAEQVRLRPFSIDRAAFRDRHGPISQRNTPGCKGACKRKRRRGGSAPKKGGTVFFRSEDFAVGTCFGRPVPRTWNRVPPPFRVKYTMPYLSVILTTNRPFKEWNEVFPNAACIVTLLDRLLHHADVTLIEGDSYRVRESEQETAARRRKK
jgi:hypothetical protein